MKNVDPSNIALMPPLNTISISRCVSGSEFLIEDLNQSYDYADLGCIDWPLETVTEKKGVPCGPAASAGSDAGSGEGTLIEIGFAVSNNLPNKVLITSCLDPTTYQSLWSRHVVPKVLLI